MLQGIRASTLGMPSFGHDLSITGVQKMEGYGDVDPWSWSAQQSPNSSSQSYSHIFDPSLYANLTPQILLTSGNAQPRHHSIATSHVLATSTSTYHPTPPPPARQHTSGTLVKPQPAFKPTWNGFLDTTKDAMTIVEAALQGRLSHISRRPHDKERAEMLTSGTVIVYEENASGIKRWTDAVHWSPSRVMNNCLIYRQLIRALKPEEKKSALNPTCGGKRKRKESASPSITNTGENLNHAEDEYENPSYDGTLADEAASTTESLEKVYANFAQSITPDQQRRFCGSLIDSYEFKEGGLMKKTISVKYQGTHHHVISYYSLEDVVNGKLKRPFEDPKLSDIQPRPELLTGWKVSLEDEESKDLPLVAAYSQHLPPNHVQHQAAPDMMQSGAPLHVQAPTSYWHGSQGPQYTAAQQPSQHYPTPEHTTSQYPGQQTNQQYTTHHAPATQHYAPQQPSSQHYASQPSSQHFASQQHTLEQYHSQPPPAHSYSPSSSRSTHQYHPEQPETVTQHYTPHQSADPYATPLHPVVAQQPQYAVPHAPAFEVPMHVAQSHTPTPHSAHGSNSQHDLQRRASAPVTLQTYGQPPHQHQYHTTEQSQSYYVTEPKYPGSPSYGF